MIQITIRSYLVDDSAECEVGDVQPSELVDELVTEHPGDAINFYKKYLGTHRIMMKVWDDDPEVNQPDTNRAIADSIIRMGSK